MHETNTVNCSRTSDVDCSSTDIGRQRREELSEVHQLDAGSSSFDDLLNVTHVDCKKELVLNSDGERTLPNNQQPTDNSIMDSSELRLMHT